MLNAYHFNHRSLGCLSLFAKLGLSTIILSLGMIKVAAAGKYDYAYYPPAADRPASADRISVWVPGTPGPAPGDPSRFLLIAAPVSGAAVKFQLKGLKYKGVYLIGFNAKGGTTPKIAPNGSSKTGGHVFEILFDPTITHRPYTFIANGYYDSASFRSTWGDFLSVGTQKGRDYPTTGCPNDASAIWAKAADSYFQKIKVVSGHYGWTTPSGDQDPHSDFVKNLGAWRYFYGSQLDVKWSYQTLLLKGTDPVNDCAHPQGQVRLKQSALRFMPPAPSIYGGSGFPGQSLEQLMIGVAAKPYTIYQAFLEDIWIGDATNPQNANKPQLAFQPTGGIAYSGGTSGLFTFPTTTIPDGSGRRMWNVTGRVSKLAPGASPPGTIVASAEVGPGAAVRSAAALLAIVKAWP